MFKAKSTTKEAKKIIIEEIHYMYGDGNDRDIKEALTIMHKDAEAYHAGKLPSITLSDYTKGASLVDAGCFRCYPSDQAEFLRKIYGESVEKWSNQKIHETYKHLIGREYVNLLKKYKIQN